MYANQYSFKPSEKREASEPLRLRYLCFCRDHLAKKKRSPKRSKYIPVFHAHTRPKTEVLLFKTLPSLALAFLTRPHGVKLQFSVRPFDYIRSLSTLLWTPVHLHIHATVQSAAAQCGCRYSSWASDNVHNKAKLPDNFCSSILETDELLGFYLTCSSLLSLHRWVQKKNPTAVLWAFRI